MLQRRMHDFVRQASKQFRWRKLRNKVRVIEQGDSIGRHGVDRWSLNVLKPQDQNPEEWEIEQQFCPALLEPHGWGECRYRHKLATSTTISWRRLVVFNEAIPPNSGLCKDKVAAGSAFNA
jgi:hypothetical protein